MMIQEQIAVGVTCPSTTIAGFSLYENATHKLTIQYPSTWNKQEILLNNDYRGLEVMFAEWIRARFSNEEDSEAMLRKIRDIVYNQYSAKVVLCLKRLPVHECYTLNDVTDDHVHRLATCFDNVKLLERSYDSKMGDMPASELLYTYTDPLQNRLPKEGMKIISVKSDKEIAMTYNSQTHDFDRLLPIIRRMVDTFTLEGT
jgi:hypothetical protein